MRRSSYPPSHLFVDAAPVVHDLPARLARLKQALGLPWDGLAACLGVDPRQLQRWRKGTLPNGFAMAALFLLADRIPGGAAILRDDEGVPQDRCREL